MKLRSQTTPWSTQNGLADAADAADAAGGKRLFIKSGTTIIEESAPSIMERGGPGFAGRGQSTGKSYPGADDTD